MNDILVVGSGELGHAIIATLLKHPTFSPKTHSLTVTSRPSTLSSQSSNPSRIAQFDEFKANNIAILPLDIEFDSHPTLTQHFHSFTTIIHAGGMTLSSGTQMKVTQAVLASTSSSATAPKKLYIPWQFGLDYDAIGPDAGNGLFAEQHAIRALLRSQTSIDWVIVSNGIFTSFLFEPAWGVVERGDSDDDDDEITVRALGSWTDALVTTTAGDIATCTAELVLVDTDQRNRPVYIAGERLSYSDLAAIVSRVSGKPVRRELWDTATLTARMEATPREKLPMYHVVFSRGVGTSWEMDDTYNAKKGMVMEGVKEWLTRNWSR